MISEVKPDKVVFLGDYFDNYGASVRQHEAAAEWLRDSLAKPERIHLWGNHDIHYRYLGQASKIAGWTHSKHEAINRVLRPDDWAKLRWFTWVDGWLCSHAGLHPDWLPPDFRLTRMALTQWLEGEACAADQALAKGRHHWMTACGIARGGRDDRGGLLWLDWNLEFRPLKNVNQIVGHTVDTAPRWKHSSQEHCRNVCLDALPYGTHYGLMRGSTLTHVRPSAYVKWKEETHAGT